MSARMPWEFVFALPVPVLVAQAVESGTPKTATSGEISAMCASRSCASADPTNSCNQVSITVRVICDPYSQNGRKFGHTGDELFTLIAGAIWGKLGVNSSACFRFVM